MQMYEYSSDQPDFDVRLAGSTSSRKHYEISFASPHKLPWREENTVYGELFEPLRDEKMPLLVLTHGWGDESLAPCLTMARLLVRQGIAVFVLYLPIHSRRQEDGEVHLPGREEWPDIYQSSVKEMRRVVDWAGAREELDAQRVTVAGISMGGIIAAIAMGVDARIKSGVFLVTGGNLEDISWGGEPKALPVGHACTREECHEVYSRYPEFLNDVGRLGLDRAVPARECFWTDPMTFSPYLRGRQILMINAEQDEIVNRSATLKLWEAYGRPRLVWLPGTHAAVYSQSAAVSTEIANFLNL